MKFRVVSGISTVLSYIGQCDLNNNFFGLPGVWYTPWKQDVYGRSPYLEEIHFDSNQIILTYFE